MSERKQRKAIKKMLDTVKIHIDNIEEITKKIGSDVRDYVGEYADVEPNEFGFLITAEDFYSDVIVDIDENDDSLLLIDLVRTNTFNRKENARVEKFDTIKEAVEFIKENKLAIGHIINCTPSEIGATNFSIEDGTHATVLANSVYTAIKGRNTVERRATLHIFAAAPNAFMFFLV